jgi:hypothetical protein
MHNLSKMMQRFFENFFSKKISRKKFSPKNLENFSLMNFRKIVENAFFANFREKTRKFQNKFFCKILHIYVKNIQNFY